MELFERILDPYFLLMFGVVMFGNGVLGFIIRFTTQSIDFLFVRSWTRNLLILVLCYIFFVAYHPAQETDIQWLLPKEETDWLSVATSMLAAYFGAWAFLCGLEKRAQNPAMFFDPEFYKKVERPKKKLGVKK